MVKPLGKLLKRWTHFDGLTLELSGGVAVRLERVVRLGLLKPPSLLQVVDTLTNTEKNETSERSQFDEGAPKRFGTSRLLRNSDASSRS